MMRNSGMLSAVMLALLGSAASASLSHAQQSMKVDELLSTYSSRRADVTAGARPAPPVRRYSQTEIHSRNPHDWVGKLHNAGLRIFTKELRKHGTTFEQACRRMVLWASDSASYVSVGKRLPRNWRSQISGATGGGNVCDRVAANGSVRKVGVTNVSYKRSPVRRMDFSSTAIALADAAESAANTADDPAELADLLGPLLDASLALTDSNDIAFVQSVISVTQNSGEYWYEDNYTQMDAVGSSAAADLDERCRNGELEGTEYQADGATFGCYGGTWWESELSRFTKRPAHGVRLASLGRARKAPCYVSRRGAYMGIIFADAAGAVTGAYIGLAGGPLGIGIGAGIWGLRLSAGGAWGSLGVLLWCNYMQ